MSIKVKGKYRLITGDCRERLKKCPDNYFDSVVCDPPYGLEFMGKEWDKLGALIETVEEGADKSYPFRNGTKRVRYGSSAKSMQDWHQSWAEEVLRVLKPGGHLLAFGGTRTYHRLACAIEDAGFQIRDCIMWVYGSGFPKSLCVSKAIDKKLGAERETIKHKPRSETSGTMSGSMDTRPWIEESRKNGFHEVAGNVPVTPEAKQYEGWGTALKPSVEPVVLARKPLIGTVAENVLEHGTGGINVDGCRIGTESIKTHGRRNGTGNSLELSSYVSPDGYEGGEHIGRFPANLILTYPEDSYKLRDDVLPEQLRNLAEWMDANPEL